jgi:hypothetical protein
MITACIVICIAESEQITTIMYNIGCNTQQYTQQYHFTFFEVSCKILAVEIPSRVQDPGCGPPPASLPTALPSMASCPQAITDRRRVPPSFQRQWLLKQAF